MINKILILNLPQLLNKLNQFIPLNWQFLYNEKSSFSRIKISFFIII